SPRRPGGYTKTVCRVPSGALAMAFTIEAVYENGVLKPAQPLPFQEHARVQITVKLAGSRVRQTAGLIGWTARPGAAHFVALSPELDPQATPRLVGFTAGPLAPAHKPDARAF